MKWLKNFMKGIHSGDTLVLSHNDLNNGNVLMENEAGKLLVIRHSTVDNSFQVDFIDYEYGGLNYRGFDLGNYFCEHYLDYSDKNWPHFSFMRNLYPQQAYTLQFLQRYRKSNSPVSYITLSFSYLLESTHEE